MKTTSPISPFPATPLLYEDLLSVFQRVGVHGGQSLIVHTSLSQLGWVMGGAETVIRALQASVGPSGNLMMPAQTWKNLDPSTGVHWDVPKSWWPQIRDHWPAFDPEVTPVIGMGVVAEMFRTWPGTVRSSHPARSFCAQGPQARFLTRDHDLSNIFGEGSPLDKLYQLDGGILLIGVGHDKNTSLHLAETRARWPGKKDTRESSALLVQGKREWVTYPTLAVDDRDFVTLGQEWEKAAGYEPVRVGKTEMRLISQRTLVDFAIKWMEANRGAGH